MTRPIRIRAFTLLELSIVVMILALLAAAAMRYSNSLAESNMIALTNTNLDVVEATLQNYRNMYGRLPCPAGMSLAESSATFGTEVGTPGNGLCTGTGFRNNSGDPDGPGGTNPGAPDPNYDAATVQVVVAGTLPVKTLRLADRFAYDGWGRRLMYVVDKRMTATNAFTTYSVDNSTIGSIVIKHTATETLAKSITYKAVYAIISNGTNGHGGYSRSLDSTAMRSSSNSVNTDELDNCHCTSTAASNNFDRVFVQKNRTTDSTNYLNNFDDIVRFKTRANLASSVELQ